VIKGVVRHGSQDAWDKGIALGDDAKLIGPNGDLPGTTGLKARADLTVPRAAYVGLGAFFLAVDTVNVFSSLHDIGRDVQGWEPVVWEYSSCALSLLLMPLVAQALRIAPPSRRHWRRFALVHAPGTVVYSLLHVGGFVLLRRLAYTEFGHVYVFGSLSNFIYEYRKDVLGYVVSLTVLAFATQRQSADSAPASTAPEATEPPVFDIREGARLIRVRTGDIIAATAAGNYVEFRLQDGRRPLMRTTLSRVEATLSAHGFVRTHRSWLVNAAHLRSVVAEGSGDFQLELEDGVQAPLSRRFPEALARLRQV
jgi:hypothetical protein